MSVLGGEALERGETLSGLDALEVTEPTEGALIPYERGLTARSVGWGVLTRFLPGSFLATVGVLLGISWDLSEPLLPIIVGSAGLAVGLSLGFGTGLLFLRRWLFPDAEVDGRRSLVAGALSPLALFITVALRSDGNLPLLVLALVLIGVLMALGMYFPWLSPTPEDMRGAAYDFDPQEG